MSKHAGYMETRDLEKVTILYSERIVKMNGRGWSGVKEINECIVLLGKLVK